MNSDTHPPPTFDNYSEDIDWDIIYRTFHNPKDIAERIAFEMETLKAPVIFCGFPEVGAYLATKADVQFVDSSPVVCKRTTERYPDIQKVSKGEISEILKDNPTRNIVVSCRVSTFWQTTEAFDELADAILAHPRDQILIDFFDRDAVYEGMHIYYKTDTESDAEDKQSQEMGDWDFKQFDVLENNKPATQIANIDISYKVEDIDLLFETRRAFFTKMAILNWCTIKLADYEATLAGPLLEDDPSFLISLKRQTKV